MMKKSRRLIRLCDSRCAAAVLAVMLSSPLLPKAQPGIALSGSVKWMNRGVGGAFVSLMGAKLNTYSDSVGNYRIDNRLAALAPRPQSPLPEFFSDAAAPQNSSDRDPRDFQGRWLGAWRANLIHAARAWNDPARAGSRTGSHAPGALPKPAGVDQLRVEARGYLGKTVSVESYQGNLDVSLDRDYRRHLWVWQNNVVSNAKARDSLFAFARLKNVGTLYLECAVDINSQAKALGDFIDSASSHGLAVELLFGQPEWTLTRNHAVPVGIAQQAALLAANLRKAGRPVPTSIQMDVEPYSLAEWTTDESGTSNQLIDMYEKISAALKGSHVGITATIPRWFDERIVTRELRTRPLSDWLADATDRLALMDYVDDSKSIIADASHEIAYSDSIGKEIIIGVETIAGLQPQTVTFAEEGEKAMNAALDSVLATYTGHASFFGVAVHHYGSYQTLKP